MTHFKLMTWNLENLYPVGSPYGPKTEEEYQAKLACLAKVILDHTPDILAVQEVGSPQAFQDLIHKLGAAYPSQQLSTHPDGRGIRVGIIAKFPFAQVEEIVDFPPNALPVPGISPTGQPVEVNKMGRGALRILIRITNQLSIHFITAHLKSKLLTYPTPDGNGRFTPKDEDEHARVAGYATMRRMAESICLRVAANRILEHNDQNALVVCGDMNDVPDSATVQLLHGPEGSDINTNGFDRPDKGDDTRLFNLAPCIPLNRRYSRITDGVRELIDHILVSQELLPGKPHILPKVDSLIDAADALPSVGANPGSRLGKPCSDHAPQLAEFTL